MRKLLCLVVFFLAICTTLFADQVVLKNGDRLTGTITKSDDKTLIIKTEAAGEVTIQLAAIDLITSAQPLHVATKEGKTLSGPVTTSDGNLAVSTPSGGTETIARADVTALRNDQEQAAYEKSLHPSLWQGWNDSATIGFGLTGGNSETKNLAVAFTGDRKTSHDEISMYANSVYTTNDEPGAVPGVTADTIQGGARYSRNFTKILFGFVGADFQSDALQALNLRSIFGGGLGLHVINTKTTTLDLLGGLNYTHESYTFTAASAAYSDSFAALTLGEVFMHKLGAYTVITESGYYYPEITYQTGQYRSTFNFGTVTKLSKWLGWQNAFGDIYVTNPPPGKKTNDLLLTTGLNVTIIH
jgi:putative salt-induced outer membrane protein YdiY